MSMFMRLRTAGSLLFTKECASFTDRGSSGSIFLQAQELVWSIGLSLSCSAVSCYELATAYILVVQI